MTTITPIYQYIDKIINLRQAHRKHYVSLIKRHHADVYNHVHAFNKQYCDVTNQSQIFYNYCKDIRELPKCTLTGKMLNFINSSWSYRTYGARGVVSQDVIEIRANKRRGKKFIKQCADQQDIPFIPITFNDLHEVVKSIHKNGRLSDTIQRLKYNHPTTLKQITMLFEAVDVPLKVKVYCVLNKLEHIPRCKYNADLYSTFINETRGFLDYNTTHSGKLHKKENNSNKLQAATEYLDRDTIVSKLSHIIDNLPSTQNLAQCILKRDPSLYKTIKNMSSISGTFAHKCYVILNGNPVKKHGRVKLHFQSFNQGFEQRFLHSNTSKGEEEIRDYINSLGIETTKIRSGKGPEIDILIPSKNIGIEYNGCYYHSNLYKTDDYHINKTSHFKQQGISILHIWETEWYNKQDIVKSILSSKLGCIKNKVFARKCELVIIDTTTKNTFLDANHIQGRDKSSTNIGLLYNGELVSLMTFTSRKITGRKTFELSRFCNRIHTNVIGGASRLFKHFIENIWDKSDIVTYCDVRFSPGGDIYPLLGFKFKHISTPNYYYFKPALPQYTKLFHRSNFMKHTLVRKLDIYDDHKTEKQNMLDNGYLYVYDCGHKVYEYTH